jgi:hypothetical protein
MNLKNLLAGRKKTAKTIAGYKQELLVKNGKEQFRKLLEKGISIPVALL